MTPKPTFAGFQPEHDRWSNRILLAAVAVILFLTLYPFRFDFSRSLPDQVPLYWLGGLGKYSNRFDAFLNVLLFVPYGFGLTGQLRKHRMSWTPVLGLVFVAGAGLSYAVEFLQIFVPLRDSGWEDVLTNSAGSVAGFVLFALTGNAAIHFFSACERFLEGLLTIQRVSWILLFYFGVWFACSVPLEQRTHLSNWKPNPFLVVGNNASGRPALAWKGEISQLEFWDHSLSADLARDLTSEKPVNTTANSPLVAYEFSGSAPFRDLNNFLPLLEWMPQSPVLTGYPPVLLDGRAWLATRAPVPALVQDIQKSGQFAVRIAFKPSEVKDVDARIVSLSDSSGVADLELRQKESSLIFSFRNPLSATRALLAWNHTDILNAEQFRNILFSYDGSNLSLYIDGKKQSGGYVLGPGATLARSIRMIKPDELEGYEYIFYGLVFFPAGCFLGIAWRRIVGLRLSSLLGIGLWILIPPMLLEILLVEVGGRPVAPDYVVLSILFAVMGTLWINADGPSLSPAHLAARS
jgi:glycopeptide antibiotics resistance protein